MSQETTGLEAATPHQDVDIYADTITEDMLTAMLDADKEPDVGQTKEANATKAFGNVPEALPEGTPEVKAPEEKEPDPTEPPDAYELELFGQAAKLTGEQLTELAEAGAQLMQHRQEVDQAIGFVNMVRANPALQSLIMAHLNEQPQGSAPQNFMAGKATAEATNPADPLEHMRNQVMAQLIPALKQQMLAEMQAHYKPFVDNVNAFADEQRREKEFHKFSADPDRAAVDGLIQHNIQAKVTAGTITYEQAAQVDAALKADPKLYGEWYGRFKEVMKTASKANTSNTGASTGDAVKITSITHAPKLEGAASDSGAGQESSRQAMTRALQGDPNAFNVLFDNQ